jgi:hypothetical protein
MSWRKEEKQNSEDPKVLIQMEKKKLTDRGKWYEKLNEIKLKQI